MITGNLNDFFPMLVAVIEVVTATRTEDNKSGAEFGTSCVERDVSA